MRGNVATLLQKVTPWTSVNQPRLPMYTRDTERGLEHLIDVPNEYDRVLVRYIKSFLPRKCANHIEYFAPLKGNYAKAVITLSSMLNDEHTGLADVRPMIEALLVAYTALGVAKQAQKDKA